MRYFELLNLRREPFSNSPDPELFYRTKQHQECLQALEITLRLKRGLSVVTGHVGTGKTTLCRQLIRVLGDRQGVVTHLILDPTFSDAREFLTYLNGLFGVDAGETGHASEWQLRENLKNALWRLAVEEDRLVVLIVDEGQKISLECLEILRELLNYETNEHKLLQIVIFGQLEFEPILAAKANLADRVSLSLRIGPLDFRDTRELIQARLTMCAQDISPEGLFSFGAFLAVYLATDGFPRQIMQLCHQALLAVIIGKKGRVTWGVVRGCMRWRSLGLPRRRRWPRLAAACLVLALLLVPAGYLAGPWTGSPRLQEIVSRVKMPDVASWFASLTGAGRHGSTSVPASESAGAGPSGQASATGADLPGVAGEAKSSTASGTSAALPPIHGEPGAEVRSLAQAQSPPSQAGAAEPAPGLAANEPGREAAGKPATETAPVHGEASAETHGRTMEPDRHPGQYRFTGVRYAIRENGAEILEIMAGMPVEKFTAGYKSGPPRIVVDMPGRWERGTGKELPVDSGRIDKVRSAVNPDKLRVVIYLKAAPAGHVQPEVEKTASGLKVILN